MQETEEKHVRSLGRFPWSRKWQYTPVFLPVKNSMDRGAWQATAHGVAKSWTWLSIHTPIIVMLMHTHTCWCVCVLPSLSSHTCVIITALPTADFLDFSLLVWIYSQKTSRSYFTKFQSWSHSFLLTIPLGCPIAYRMKSKLLTCNLNRLTHEFLSNRNFLLHLLLSVVSYPKQTVGPPKSHTHSSCRLCSFGSLCLKHTGLPLVWPKVL